MGDIELRGDVSVPSYHVEVGGSLFGFESPLATSSTWQLRKRAGFLEFVKALYGQVTSALPATELELQSFLFL